MELGDCWWSKETFIVKIHFIRGLRRFSQIFSVFYRENPFSCLGVIAGPPRSWGFISTAIFSFSFSAAISFFAPKSISIPIPPTLITRGSWVIFQLSFCSAVLTISWNKSLWILSFVNVKWAQDFQKNRLYVTSRCCPSTISIFGCSCRITVPIWIFHLILHSFHVVVSRTGVQGIRLLSLRIPLLTGISGRTAESILSRMGFSPATVEGQPLHVSGDLLFSMAVSVDLPGLYVLKGNRGDGCRRNLRRPSTGSDQPPWSPARPSPSKSGWSPKRSPPSER